MLKRLGQPQPPRKTPDVSAVPVPAARIGDPCPSTRSSHANSYPLCRARCDPAAQGGKGRLMVPSTQWCKVTVRRTVQPWSCCLRLVLSRPRNRPGEWVKAPARGGGSRLRWSWHQRMFPEDPSNPLRRRPLCPVDPEPLRIVCRRPPHYPGQSAHEHPPRDPGPRPTWRHFSPLTLGQLSCASQARRR